MDKLDYVRRQKGVTKCMSVSVSPALNNGNGKKKKERKNLLA